MTPAMFTSRFWPAACAKCGGAVLARYGLEPTCINCGAVYTEDEMTRQRTPRQPAPPPQDGPSPAPAAPTRQGNPAQAPPRDFAHPRIDWARTTRQEHAAFLRLHAQAIRADMEALTGAAILDKWGIPPSNTTYYRLAWNSPFIPPGPRRQGAHSSPAPALPAPAIPAASPRLRALQDILVILEHLPLEDARRIVACLVAWTTPPPLS